MAQQPFVGCLHLSQLRDMSSAAALRPASTSRIAPPITDTPSSHSPSTGTRKPTIAKEKSEPDRRTPVTGHRSELPTTKRPMDVVKPIRETAGFHLARPRSKPTPLPPPPIETKTCRNLLITAESAVKTALGSTRRVSTSDSIRRTASIKLTSKDGQKPLTTVAGRSPEPKQKLGIGRNGGTLARKPSKLTRACTDQGESTGKVVGVRGSMIQLGPTNRRASVRPSLNEAPMVSRTLDSDIPRLGSVSSTKRQCLDVSNSDQPSERTTPVSTSKRAVRPIRRSLRLQSRPLIAKAIPAQSSIKPLGSRSSSIAAPSLIPPPCTPANSKSPRVSKSTPQLSPITPFSPTSTSSGTVQRAARSPLSTDMLLSTPALRRVVSRQWTDAGDISMDMIQDTSLSSIQGQEDGGWDTPIVKKSGLKRSLKGEPSSISRREASPSSISDRHVLAVQQKYETLLEDETRRAEAAEQARKDEEEQSSQEVAALREEMEALGFALQAMQAERDTAHAAVEDGKRLARRGKWEEVLRAGEEAIEEERNMLVMIAHLRTMLGIPGTATSWS